jgi:hypothetical protein
MNENFIHEEIKRRFRMGNACYHSVQSSCLMSKNIKIRIYKTRMLPAVLQNLVSEIKGET